MLVLTHDLGEQLHHGQIEELAHKDNGEKPWEQHADMSLHERLFTSFSLLYQSSPRRFPPTDAVAVSVAVRGADPAPSIEWTVRSEPAPDGGLTVHVVSSAYWLGTLRDANPYTVQAWVDAVPEEG